MKCYILLIPAPSPSNSWYSHYPRQFLFTLSNFPYPRPQSPYATVSPWNWIPLIWSFSKLPLIIQFHCPSRDNYPGYHAQTSLQVASPCVVPTNAPPINRKLFWWNLLWGGHRKYSFMEYPALSLGEAQDAGSLLQLTAHSSHWLSYWVSWFLQPGLQQVMGRSEIKYITNILYRALPFATLQRISVSLVYQHLIC